MTNEEAIETLRANYPDVCFGQLREAVDMAIKALTAQADSKELSFTHKALDTISRKAAIDAHYEYCNKHPDAGFPVWSLKILEDLPSAQPERKKGEWIDNETSYADGVRQTCTCSVCGIKSVRPLGNFCRWCGADMRGQQDE